MGTLGNKKAAQCRKSGSPLPDRKVGAFLSDAPKCSIWSYLYNIIFGGILQWLSERRIIAISAYRSPAGERETAYRLEFLTHEKPRGITSGLFILCIKLWIKST